MKSRTISSIMMMVVLFAFVATSGSAAATPGATRALPASVLPGADFRITMSYSDIGSMGQVNETLPDGFTYVSSSLSSSAVVTGIGWAKFTLISGLNFTYTVTASDVVGTHTFSGTVKDEDKNVAVIGGKTTMKVGVEDTTTTTSILSDTTATAAPPGEHVTPTPVATKKPTAKLASAPAAGGDETMPDAPAKKGLPGFEGTIAIAGLLAIGYVMTRWKR